MAPGTHTEVDRRMLYRQPTSATVAVHERVRASFVALAHQLVDDLPGGSAAEHALDSLWDALLWANASIAVDTPAEQPVEPIVAAGEQPQAE